MGKVTDKIRTHIGEGELSEAIETLAGYLQSVGGDYYNQTILLKGKYKDYRREKMMGMADNEQVKSRISMAVLDLASQIDKGEVEQSGDSSNLKIRSPEPKKRKKKKAKTPAPPSQPQYTAQCFFTGDMMQYYITGNDQIVAINPLTNQTLMVGVKMPSQDTNYAWTYYVNATGVFYLADHAGILWGQNSGILAQVGYVKYF
jgi:effector-associated domain 11 (EAD11)-containing protein